MADEFPSEMMFTHQIPRHLLTVAARGADVDVGGGHPLIWKKASRFQYSQRWAIDIEVSWVVMRWESTLDDRYLIC